MVQHTATGHGHLGELGCALDVSLVATISGATSCTHAASVKASHGQKRGAAYGNQPRTPRGAQLLVGLAKLGSLPFP